ncbi:MAG: DNA translocase FtsK [Christensenellales bacterium]
MKNNSGENQNRSNRIFNGLMITGLSLLLFCILVGVFGKAGGYVRNFFVGVFGYAVYGYTLAALLSGILMIFGRRATAKPGATLCYILTLVIIVMICHVSLTKHLATAGYSAYIKACYDTADTPAGWLGALVAYPMCKAYVFAMIILSLLLAGLIAMAIVVNVNSEIVFPSTGRVKVFGKKKDNATQTPDAQDAPVKKRELYNGTVSGKNLSNNIGKGYLSSNKPLEYEPLESMDFNDEESGDIMDENGTLINPQEVKNSVELQRQAVLDFWYNDGAIPQTPQYRGDKTVDVSKSKFGLRSNASQPKAEQTQESSSEPAQLDERYKSYSNNYRMQQMMKNMGIDGGEQESNSVNNDFMQEIENALNQGLQEYGQSSVAQDDAWNNDESDDSQIQSKQEEVNVEPLQSADAEAQAKEAEKQARAERLRQLREKQAQRQRANQQAEEEKRNEQQAKEVEETPVNFPYQSLRPDFSAMRSQNQASVQNNQPAKEEPAKEPKPRVILPYNPPSLDCLKDYQEDVAVDSDYLETLSGILTSKMADFGVDIHVCGIVKGPTFSRIEFETNAQLGRITSKYNDIVMWLGVESMRLEAPIPGKRCCGIEIPNKNRGTVGLKAVINSPEFNNTDKEGLYFALGKDIDGNCYVSDITKFPHALVAGASGAGKSVCLNGMICSMLYKYSPEELRMILVDPKVVELNVYRNIPHLLIPQILSEEKKVINALKWAVDEMEKRYQLMTDMSVANLAQYNEEVDDKSKKLPFILIVIDEVGDIILSPVGKEFQVLVKKLAAKARAAGIHLILATQRPSVDVITGTIKSNLPTRIAFAVTSGVDSKTILDCQGAEKLLRMGDMLYKEAVKPNPVRVQGAFIHTKEVKAIVEQVKSRNQAYFDDDVVNFINKTEEESVVEAESGDKKNSEFPDELCLDVLDYGLTNSTISISGLQRRFALGFNRAGRIVDWLKSKGYIRMEGKTFVFALNEEQVEQLKKRALEGDEE